MESGRLIREEKFLSFMFTKRREIWRGSFIREGRNYIRAFMIAAVVVVVVVVSSYWFKLLMVFVA